MPTDPTFSVVLDNSIAIAFATIVGYFLKNKFPKFNNQAIPVTNFAVQFLGSLILQIKPAEAASLSAVGAAAQSVLVQSLFATVVASGAQSSLKATGRTFLSFLKAILLQKAADAVAKEQAKEGGAAGAAS